MTAAETAVNGALSVFEKNCPLLMNFAYALL